jgi:hypothetical protein
MNNQNSSLKKFLILGDSHVKHLGRNIRTRSTRLVIKAFSGLKWVDNYDDNLSLYHMLDSPDIDYYLSNFDGVLFFVGTNSVRIMPAHKIITQIKVIINYIREKYPRFNQTGKITIPYVFPCLKTTNRFRTEQAMLSNIALYNHELKQLSFRMNFSIMNLHLTQQHLASDNMHIHEDFYRFMYNRIVNYFSALVYRSSTTATTRSYSTVRSRQNRLHNNHLNTRTNV